MKKGKKKTIWNTCIKHTPIDNKKKPTAPDGGYYN